jgi:hypothetical protein
MPAISPFSGGEADVMWKAQEVAEPHFTQGKFLL